MWPKIRIINDWVYILLQKPEKVRLTPPPPLCPGPICQSRMKRGGGGRHHPHQIFCRSEKKPFKDVFLSPRICGFKNGHIFFWSDVYIGWFSLLTKKTRTFLGQKLSFSPKMHFFRVFSKALFDRQNIEKITFCLFENASYSCVQLETGAQRCFVVIHIPGNPNKPLEMPFEVGLGVPECFFWKSPKIATLGRFGSFLGHF